MISLGNLLISFMFFMWFKFPIFQRSFCMCSAVEVTVPAKGKAIVATDFSIAVPIGTYGRVAPRSGLAVKNFIDVGAGVVDADYRGPLGVVLFNFSEVDFKGTLASI